MGGSFAPTNEGSTRKTNLCESFDQEHARSVHGYVKRVIYVSDLTCRHPRIVPAKKVNELGTRETSL